MILILRLFKAKQITKVDHIIPIKTEIDEPVSVKRMTTESNFFSTRSKTLQLPPENQGLNDLKRRISMPKIKKPKISMRANTFTMQ